MLNLTKTCIAEINMKPYHLLILMITATILMLPACDQTQTGSEKVMNKVDDALDRRPGEKVRGAAEDVRDEIKDALEEIQEKAEDAAH